ncbi:hypothetical protein [Aquimarina hainanensis]|uniref:hypothetical protein n=1 Tax=Aquimarina hainanensis TaxID=1578017 RepID=UPI003620B641
MSDFQNKEKYFLEIFPEIIGNQMRNRVFFRRIKGVFSYLRLVFSGLWLNNVHLIYVDVFQWCNNTIYEKNIANFRILFS